MAQLKDTKVAGTLSVSGNISSGSLGTHMKSDSLEIYSATTPYIDFHAGGTTTDYSHRILAQSDGKLVITASTLSLSGGLAATGNITTSGSLSVGDIPNTLKNLCSKGAANAAPGYVLGFNTDYLSAGYTSVKNLRNTMGLGNTTGALPVANGGTGGTTKATARTGLGMGSIFGTAYTLTCTISEELNGWNITSCTAYLIGNQIRFYIAAEKSSSTGAGNIDNQRIGKITLGGDHISKVGGLYNTTTGNGSGGGVLSLYTYDVSGTSFYFGLAATHAASTAVGTYFQMACTIAHANY